MKRGTRQKTKCVAHGSGDIKQLQANCASEEMISPRCTATRTQVSRSIKWSKVTGPGAATKTKKHVMTVGVAPPVKSDNDPRLIVVVVIVVTIVVIKDFLWIMFEILDWEFKDDSFFYNLKCCAIIFELQNLMIQKMIQFAEIGAFFYFLTLGSGIK